MSRTAVSELNARMSLDVSQLETAVPRASALLKRLSAVQAEAFASQSEGPDIQAMTERMRASAKAAQRVAVEGGTATFRTPEAAKQFTDPIADAHEYSIKRRAAQLRALQQLQSQVEKEDEASLRNRLAGIRQEIAMLRAKGKAISDNENRRLATRMGQESDIVKNLAVQQVAMRNLGTTAADSQKSYARFGVAAQQVGYQVQDFAVQVASGTNALVALSQQGSQLLGFFGGFAGAIAGAVLSTGILAYRLSDVGTSAKDSKTEVEDLLAKIKELGDARRGLAAAKDPTLGPVFDRRLAERDIAAADKASQRFASALKDARDAEAEVAALKEKNPIGGSFLSGLIGGSKSPDIASRELDQRVRLLAAEDKLAKAEAERAVAKQAYLSAEIAAIKAREGIEKQEYANKQAEVALEFALAEGRAKSLREEIEMGNQAFLREQEKKKAAKAEAEAVLDRLDARRKEARELERIAALQKEGLFGDRDVTAEMRARMQDERERKMKLPDAFRPTTGASFAGLRNTDGTAQQQISLLQQQVNYLRTLVSQGAN